MDTQPVNTQSPALGLALALDPFGELLLANLHQQHMNGNPAYQNIRSLALRKQDSAFRLVSLGTETTSDSVADPLQNPISHYGDLRREAYQSLIVSAASLRQSFEIALHELRAHPRLLQSGLAYHLIVNLNIFLVGDFTNPQTNGLIFPLLAVLQDILENEPFCTLACLLRVALFPGSSGANPDDSEAARLFQQSAAGLHVALSELDYFLKPGAEGLFRKVNSDLGLSVREAIPQQIFLFDRRKEGSLMVQDEPELGLIMGNFLLALLSGGLPQRLSGLGSLDSSGSNPVYNGAAASALLYQPEPLIQACTTWLGSAFLANAFPEEKSPDLALATDLAEKVLPALGSLPEWLDQGCQELPFQVSQAETRPGLTMHLDGPGFQNTPPSEWANLLRQYRDHLFDAELPVYWKNFTAQFHLNHSARLDELKKWLLGFVQDGLGRGAGFLTLAQSVQVVEGQILSNVRHIQELGVALSQTSATELEAALEGLSSLAARPPYRPSLGSLKQTLREAIAAQPAQRRGIQNLRAWLSDVIVRWLRRGELEFIEAREACLRCIEFACTVRFLENILPVLLSNSESLQGLLVQSYEDIDDLEEIFRLARLELEVQSRDALAALFPAAPLFRPRVITSETFRWARAYWQPGWEEMRIALIHQAGFLNDWRQLSPEALEERLLTYCRMIYAPGLANLSLFEVIDHGETRLAQGMPAAMLAGSIPLLRANFDRLGGGATAWEMHGVQTCACQPEMLQGLATQTALEWEHTNSSDRRALFIFQVRQGLPLQALIDLLRQGQKACESLGADPCKLLCLFNERLNRPVDEKSNGRYRTAVE